MRSLFRTRLASLLLIGALVLSACADTGVSTESAEAPPASALPEVDEPVAEEAEPVEQTAPAEEPEPTEEPELTEEAEPAAVESPVEVTALPEELQGVLASTAGEQIDLATLRGQDVVLWFWAPW